MSETLESGTFSIMRILNLKRERDEARREAVKLFAELEKAQQDRDSWKRRARQLENERKQREQIEVDYVYLFGGKGIT